MVDLFDYYNAVYRNERTIDSMLRVSVWYVYFFWAVYFLQYIVRIDVSSIAFLAILSFSVFLLVKTLRLLKNDKPYGYI